MVSPSVCARGTWKAWISSPFRWKVVSAENVTTGSASFGAGFVFMPMNSMNCSELMRFLTLSWATITAPALPRFSLPPVWSPCQCVFSTNFTGLAEIAPMAARTSLA